VSFGAGPNGLLWRDGDEVVDLSGLGDVFARPTLNELLAAGRSAWEDAVAAARSHDGPRVPEREIHLRLPFEVADYVDFYSSLEHATNLGRMFRPDSEPLLPNWRHLPVGYHGRAGTVVLSGTAVRRPQGQSKPPDADAPSFGPSRRLDIELELGFVVGVASSLGEPLPA
jgi:fumarylacetoacetase